MTVVLPPDGVYVSRFRSLGVDVIEFPLDKISLLQVFRFVSVISTLRPDILHSHGKGAGFYARMVSQTSCPAKRVHSYHGFHPPQNRVAAVMYQALEHGLLHNVDIVAAVSISEGKGIQRRFPTFKGMINAIPNIVDCTDLVKRSEVRLDDKVLDFLAANANMMIVTMVARKDPVKNHALAFRACRLLLKQDLNVAFIFVGMDPNDADFVSLKNTVSPHRVLAIPALMDAAAIIRRSHIVLLTSRKEGSPLVVLEAFCFGKAVVGTNVEGIRDLVRDGHNGLLCDQSEEDLAAAIGKLSFDRSLLDRLSENALSFAHTMDVSAWTKEYHTMYSSL